MTDLSGGFTDPPVQAATAFRGILNVMARPGEIAEVAGHHGPAPLSDAAAAVLLTLVDRTTKLHLAASHDNADMRQWLAFHCGAPLVDAGEAEFALGDWASLMPLDRFAIGTPEYPDRAATLIVDGHDFDAAPATLRGPGIKDTADLALPEREAFVANHARFPLGWDAIFCGGTRIAALPRSTEIS
ncbi:phosphonate C-P lyase system protein PhnH [Paracoccus sp. SCSIO 75233]|uniref:phosphonate C-P lyase system protein PhnH n=1 Tax=Paracoccus sp. SCSIO 75233 TaxID=3017782 RepID=UPI0022EFDB81|nr:phosphonate C-P lyase system protein PhnH [Paracoccus sp. SCSIO 75233]WBU51936.1 phosphonate C-P lyase system protein PhnH [Paracoccus sp. SCSIO 75233]